MWVLDTSDELDGRLVLADIPQLDKFSVVRVFRESTSTLTPSHATIKNSSDGSRVVSVVYGEPTTNSFIEASPRDLVTASTPNLVSAAVARNR